jgi:hypothetical protein
MPGKGESLGEKAAEAGKFFLDYNKAQLEFAKKNMGTIFSVAGSAAAARFGAGPYFASLAQMRGLGIAGQAMFRLFGSGVNAGMWGALGKTGEQALDIVQGKSTKTPGQIIDEQANEFVDQATAQLSGEMAIAVAGRAAQGTVGIAESFAKKSAAYKREIELQKIAKGLAYAHEAQASVDTVESLVSSFRTISSPSLADATLEQVLKNADHSVLSYARSPYYEIIDQLQHIPKGSKFSKDVYVDLTKAANRMQEVVSAFPQAEGGVAKPLTEVDAMLIKLRRAAKQGEAGTPAQAKRIKEMAIAGGKMPKPDFRGEEFRVEAQKFAEKIQSGEIDIDDLKDMIDDPELAQDAVALVIGDVAYNKNTRLTESIVAAKNLSQFAWNAKKMPGGDRIYRALAEDVGGKKSPLTLFNEAVEKSIKDEYGTVLAQQFNAGKQRWGQIAEIRKQAWYQSIFPDSVTGQSSAADKAWTFIEPNRPSQMKDMEEVFRIGTLVKDKKGVVDVAKSATAYEEAMGMLRSQFLNGLLYQSPASTAAKPVKQGVANLVGFKGRVKEYGDDVLNVLFPTPVLKTKLNEMLWLSEDLTGLSKTLSRDLNTKHFLSKLEDNIAALEAKESAMMAAGTKQGETDISYGSRRMGGAAGAGLLAAMYGGFQPQSALYGLGTFAGIYVGGYYLGNRLPLAIMKGADNPQYAGFIRNFIDYTKNQNLEGATAVYRSLLLALNSDAETLPTSSNKRVADTMSNVRRFTAAKNNLFNWSLQSLSTYIKNQNVSERERQEKLLEDGLKKKLGPSPTPVPLTGADEYVRGLAEKTRTPGRVLGEMEARSGGSRLGQIYDEMNAIQAKLDAPRLKSNASPYESNSEDKDVLRIRLNKLLREEKAIMGKNSMANTRFMK